MLEREVQYCLLYFDKIAGLWIQNAGESHENVKKMQRTSDQLTGFLAPCSTQVVFTILYWSCLTKNKTK
jgi:hypothetical protein